MAGLATRLDALEHNPVRDAGRIVPSKPKRVPRALSVAEVRLLRALLTYDNKALERDPPDLVDMLLAAAFEWANVWRSHGMRSICRLARSKCVAR
jgi:hypothetical protein